MSAPVKIHTSPMRRAAFERDAGICAQCATDCEKIKRVYLLIRDSDAQWFYGDLVRYNDKVFWEADHVIERADKGPDVIENIQTLCRPCHVEKTKDARRERENRKRFQRITGEDILALIVESGGGLKIGGPTGLWQQGLFDDEIRKLIRENRPAVIASLRLRDGQEIQRSYRLLEHIEIG